MPFWDLQQPGTRVALIQGQTQLDYAALAALADQHAARLPAAAGIGLLCMPSHVDAIAFYLGALRSGRQVPLLLQADTSPELLAALVAHYRPDWIVSSGDGHPGYSLAWQGDTLGLQVRDDAGSDDAPHPELALLLSTSGSTGSSKLVRLSAAALDANAGAIVQYLGLGADDRAITTLPLAYSFGMSILNSHLAVGASIVLSEHSLMTREFWDTARSHAVTSLSGVPATFEILRRMGLARLQLPSLRMLTQAGGRLRDELVAYFAEASQQQGLAFFVMYGQTEASPRISYVPAQRIADKVGSIGIPIPGGQLRIDPATSELIYTGANVMMGYAQERGDLGRGDEMRGELRTGDLARVDDDGFHYITGRAKRFLKISGNRVNLDDVEAMLSAALGQQIVCSGGDDDLVAFSHGEAVAEQAHVRQLVQQRYKLFGGHVRTLHLPALPLLGSGKVDYQSLRQMTAQGAAP